MKSKPEHFQNDGFGWRCLECSKSAAKPTSASRLMNEGEAESKLPEMSEPARAKWMNAEKTSLVCPLCGTSERIID